MTANERKPVELVVGPLGAGKTVTFNELLKHKSKQGKRTALVVNEFGEEGVDGSLIEHSGNLPVIELSNGCICCTLGTSFPDTLRDLLRVWDRFDDILVEGSGVTNPLPLLQTFFRKGVIQEHYRPGDIFAVLPSNSWQRHRKENATRFDAQVACARKVLLNKTDRVTGDEVIRLENFVRGLNPDAMIYRTEHGQINENHLLDLDESEWFSTMSERMTDNLHDHQDCDHEHDQCRHNHHEDDSTDGLISTSIKLEGYVDESKFNDWAGTLLFDHGEDLFRIKGFLNLLGEEHRIIFQTACDDSPDPEEKKKRGKPWGNGPRHNLLVFIFVKESSLTRKILEDGFTSCVFTS